MYDAASRAQTLEKVQKVDGLVLVEMLKAHRNTPVLAQGHQHLRVGPRQKTSLRG